MSGEQFMGQEIPEQDSDQTLASASTNPTPPQDGGPEPLRDDKQLIVPETVKAGDDVQSPKTGSTGPRSKAGKQRSSQNALKHGVFAQVVLVPGESRSKYRLLLKNLRNDWQPEGATEEFFVEMIANIMLRLRRVYTAESAEIRRSREFLQWDKRQSQTGEAEEIGTSKPFVSDGGLIWKIRNPVILEHCLELLLELQREIEESGLKPERDTAILNTICGPNEHLRETLHQSYLAYLTWAKKEKSRSQDVATIEDFKKYFLSRISKEIIRLQDYQKELASVESERMELEVLRRNVPRPEINEHLRKNEAALLKELERTINLLDRMQRLRRGQPVAPRIDVNL
jgi:hypothetical protein